MPIVTLLLRYIVISLHILTINKRFRSHNINNLRGILLKLMEFYLPTQCTEKFNLKKAYETAAWNEDSL